MNAVLKAVTNMVNPGGLAPIDTRAESPALAREQDKLQDFIGRDAELSRTLEHLRRDMSNASGAQDALDARADALLDSGAVIESKEARLERMSQQSAEVRDEQRVVRRVIEKQRVVVDGEERRIGAVLTARLLPQHKRNVQRIAKALVELDAAMVAEQALRDTFRDGGVTYVHEIIPMAPPYAASFRIGGSKGYDSMADTWLAEAKQRGLL